MPAPQVHAVVRTFTLALVALALIAPVRLGGRGAAQRGGRHHQRVPRRCSRTSSPTTPTAVARSPSSRTRSRRTARPRARRSAPASTSANAGFTGSDSVHLHGAQRRRRGGHGHRLRHGHGVHGAAGALPAQRRRRGHASRGRPSRSIPLVNDTGTGKTLSSQRRPEARDAHGLRSGICNYKPNDGYTGSDGFVYAITDSTQRTAGERRRPHPRGARRARRTAIDSHRRRRMPVASGGQALVGVCASSACPRASRGEELRALGLPSGSGDRQRPARAVGQRPAVRPRLRRPGRRRQAQLRRRRRAPCSASRATQTFPRPLPPISQGTGGDGHVPILVGSKVFAIYHHCTADVR